MRSARRAPAHGPSRRPDLSSPLDRRQPPVRAGVLASDQCVIRLLLRSRDRTGASRTDGAEIDLPKADHLGGGAADEYLVGRVELVAGEGLLLDAVSEVGEEMEDRVAGQALQDVRVGGSEDVPAADEEDVLAGALRH